MTDDLDGLRGNNRRCGCLSSPISSRNCSFYNVPCIGAAKLDVIGRIPEVGSTLVGSDQKLIRMNAEIKRTTKRERCGKASIMSL